MIIDDFEKKGKIIVLKAEGDITNPFEMIKNVDYKDYKSIQGVVGGFIEHFYAKELPEVFGYLNIDFWCNEEFLLDDNIKTVNALASLLSGQLIYGDVAITVSEPEGESRGFEYKEAEDGEEDICECWLVEDLLMRTVSNNQQAIIDFYEEHNGKKPKPMFGFSTMNEKEIKKGKEVCDE